MSSLIRANASDIGRANSSVPQKFYRVRGIVSGLLTFFSRDINTICRSVAVKNTEWLKSRRLDIGQAIYIFISLTS